MNLFQFIKPFQHLRQLAGKGNQYNHLFFERQKLAVPADSKTLKLLAPNKLITGKNSGNGNTLCCQPGQDLIRPVTGAI